MPLQRRAGILLHPTSLPSRGGIGDLGQEAYAFADFLARAKQGLWQILPVSPPGINHSPYSAISAFAGNPLLVSLERLAEHGWIDRARIAAAAAVAPGTQVDFEEVEALKLPILRQAAQSFLDKHQDLSAAGRRRFEDFKRENSWWLDDFVLFQVIRRTHEGAEWSSWPRALARRDPEGLRQFGVEYQRELEVERAIQFAFFEQWRALRRYCAARAIRIVGDVAIFVDYDSADVWRNPELFYLDENLQPTVVSGVPPDAFSDTGQRWGNPLYRWDVSRASGFHWWIQRIAWALQTCDILRLDHFRGFESYWEIPASEETAIHGQWKKGPQDELFQVLRQRFGDLPFIAEDLGIITPEVRALRERLDIPGMKVLQFAFGDPGARIYLPHNFPPNCVVYSGTHDNDTTLGWWRAGASKEERTNVEAYLGQANDSIPWVFIRLALASVARMAVVPLQDVLGLSSDARMNTPARIQGNWGWRFAPGVLRDELADKLAALTTMCDRAPEPLPADPPADEEAREDFAA
jgi:4-alpha-glucanotransferase